MSIEQHAEHGMCARPGCPSFHLFCPDCGGRHHLGDVSETSTASAVNDLTGRAGLADLIGLSGLADLPGLAGLVVGADAGAKHQAAALELDVVSGRDEHRLAAGQR